MRLSVMMMRVMMMAHGLKLGGGGIVGGCGVDSDVFGESLGESLRVNSQAFDIARLHYDSMVVF